MAFKLCVLLAVLAVVASKPLIHNHQIHIVSTIHHHTKSAEVHRHTKHAEVSPAVRHMDNQKYQAIRAEYKKHEAIAEKELMAEFEKKANIAHQQDTGNPQREEGVPDTEDLIPEIEETTPVTEEGTPEMEDGIQDTEEAISTMEEGTPETESDGATCNNKNHHHHHH
eukprot:scpid105359/ scgid32306/ 